MTIVPLADLGHRPLLMGVLNITPDSFSGDGLLTENNYVAAALDLAEHMLADGADILDIGGESTRPGATPVDAAEEIKRVLPVIEILHTKWPSLPLSVDTMKPDVAQMALKAGASIVNDVSRMKQDFAMLKLAASSNAYLVIMHNRALEDAFNIDNRLGGEYKAPSYVNVVAEVMKDLHALASRALAAGVSQNRLILDPGLGFGKSVEQNLLLINEMEKLKELGYPILAAPSRKSFVGRVLDLPVDERLEGTAAAVAICALHGADILRVHDVKEMARVVKMVSAITSPGIYANGLPPNSGHDPIQQQAAL